MGSDVVTRLALFTLNANICVVKLKILACVLFGKYQTKETTYFYLLDSCYFIHMQVA